MESGETGGKTGISAVALDAGKSQLERQDSALCRDGESTWSADGSVAVAARVAVNDKLNAERAEELARLHAERREMAEEIERLRAAQQVSETEIRRRVADAVAEKTRPLEERADRLAKDLETIERERREREAARRALIDEDTMELNMQFACEAYCKNPSKLAFLVPIFKKMKSLSRFALVAGDLSSDGSASYHVAACDDNHLWHRDAKDVNRIFMEKLLRETKRKLREITQSTEDDASVTSEMVEIAIATLGREPGKLVMDSLVKTVLATTLAELNAYVQLDTNLCLTNFDDAVVEFDPENGTCEVRKRRRTDYVSKSVGFNASDWIEPDVLDSTKQARVDRVNEALERCFIDEETRRYVLAFYALSIFRFGEAMYSKTILMVCTLNDHGKSYIIKLLMAAGGDYVKQISREQLRRSASETSRAALICSAKGVRIYCVDELPEGALGVVTMKMFGAGTMQVARRSAKNHLEQPTFLPQLAVVCNPLQLSEDAYEVSMQDKLSLIPGMIYETKTPIMAKFTSNRDEVNGETVFLRDSTLEKCVANDGPAFLRILFQSLPGLRDFHLKGDYPRRLRRKRDEEWLAYEREIEKKAQRVSAAKRLKVKEKAKAEVEGVAQESAEDDGPRAKMEVRVVDERGCNTKDEFVEGLVCGVIEQLLQRKGARAYYQASRSNIEPMTP